MQRTRLNRGIILIISYVLVLGLLIFIDQITKIHFENKFNESGNTDVISGFFYFTFTKNTGAAFSFLAKVSWGQAFFKVLTIVSLAVFVFLTILSHKKGCLFFTFALIITLSGTIGNFIDRMSLDYVRDFIGFIFGSYYFPIFNFADICLTVGVIMIVVHLLFLDDNAIFKKSNGSQDNSGRE